MALATVARRLLGALVVAFSFLAPTPCAGQSFEDLLTAAEDGIVPTVSAFLGKGLDPNTADANGNTLLMIAARKGHRDLVAYLINRKASVTRRSPYGDTALMFASLKGHLAVARLLVDNGAVVSHEGWSPLHYAAFEGRADVVQYLIGKGADKNGLAPNEYTPLMLAAMGGHIDAARILLYEDADVTVKGPKGETALSIAKSHNHAELVILLARAGAVE